MQPANATGPLSLVGLGLRTVSFLSIRVYVAGFYVSDDAIAQIKRTWKNFSKEAFPATEGDANSEALVGQLLDGPYDVAIRINPYRKTDFAHWRDSFSRSIQKQLQEGLRDKRLSNQEAEAVAASLIDLKGCFPSSSAPANEPLLLLRKADGTLRFEYKGATLGTIENTWTAKHLILAYFSRKNVISQKLQDSVAEGFEQLLSS